MKPKLAIQIGNSYPFDASDNWREGSVHAKPPAPASEYHRAARAVIADLQDRSGIKQELDNIDEETRIEIVDNIAAIIKEVLG